MLASDLDQLLLSKDSFCSRAPSIPPDDSLLDRPVGGEYNLYLEGRVR